MKKKIGLLKLVQVPDDKTPVVHNGLWRDKFNRLFLNDKFKLETLIELQCNPVDVIVISRHEDIQEGDYTYLDGELSNRSVLKNEVETANNIGALRVLLKTDQISIPFIKDIVSDNITDADLVEIECDEKGILLNKGIANIKKI